MVGYGKDDDAFDPKEIKRMRKLRNENKRRPGSGGITCSTCGQNNNPPAIAGCCCWNCNNTLR